MVGTSKKLRFKLAWQQYRVGDVIEPNGTLRDWLIGHGYCDVVDDKSPVRSQSVNRQMVSPNKRNSHSQANR